MLPLHIISIQLVADGGAGLVLWAGGPPHASFGFYLREAFHSQTSAENIKSR